MLSLGLSPAGWRCWGEGGSSLGSEPCSSRTQPSPCPRSVVEAAKAHPAFGELFQFATPVLMWDQHFSPDTWNRLKERHVPYGWQGLSHAGTAPSGLGVVAAAARGGSRGLGTPGEWEPGNLVPSHSTSPGAGWRARLCKCHSQHLVTFSPDKSSSVCMIINWGPEDLGQPAPLLPEEIVSLPTQTYSLLSPAAASFRPWAGKCWGQPGGGGEPGAAARRHCQDGK